MARILETVVLPEHVRLFRWLYATVQLKGDRRNRRRAGGCGAASGNMIVRPIKHQIRYSGKLSFNDANGIGALDRIGDRVSLTPMRHKDVGKRAAESCLSTATHDRPLRRWCLLGCIGDHAAAGDGNDQPSFIGRQPWPMY